MAGAIGWYGPLIDLSKAASHIGDYVQLLVFVHRTTPVQYKMAKGGREVIRTDIQMSRLQDLEILLRPEPSIARPYNV